MVARRLEDGVQVERRHAEVLEVAELLPDALERPAVEVPARHAAVGRALVGGRRVPILDEGPLGAALARDGERLGGALLPVLAPGKPVGEDLGRRLPRGTTAAVAGAARRP